VRAGRLHHLIPGHGSGQQGNITAMQGVHQQGNLCRLVNHGRQRDLPRQHSAGLSRRHGDARRDYCQVKALWGGQPVD